MERIGRLKNIPQLLSLTSNKLLISITVHGASANIETLRPSAGRRGSDGSSKRVGGHGRQRRGGRGGRVVSRARRTRLQRAHAGQRGATVARAAVQGHQDEVLEDYHFTCCEFTSIVILKSNTSGIKLLLQII